ncbi:membrane-associated phospholipid phosphatase [Microbacterium sp. SORGH_AS428]|uniref:phosphatase PAP2 family protein n=1 Tax=Microbacterium sp. SORGH_AS_0428 TaxID=3041788 RepID=UPI00286080D7|nr:phosphatase PAP2 family protein [Microbacterium sp. SORGH_AS_0428]MDR6200654.1 membrane-associated phospholipid phosphatase [Microbacterium sp. SORGH_AS_0428]
MSHARASSRRGILWLGGGLVAIGVAIGVWIVLSGDAPFAIDTTWNDLLAAIASPFLTQLSLFLNVAGGTLVGSLVVPVVGVTILMLARRPWSAATLVIAIAASALVVQILKNVFARGRPADMTVLSDFGSYPSGHVANAATVATMLVVLLPRVWTIVVAAAWVLLMAFSRTYLHAHWLTDAIGGIAVGVGVALVCVALLERRLEPERR